MPTSPVPSVARGDITLQPSYFTSSLFVTPLREDIAQLVQIFAQAYFQPSLQNGVQGEEDTVMLPDEASASTYLNASQQPFAYFKRLWTNYGWSWLHFKVFDGRARESFVRVVFRCFSGAYCNECSVRLCLNKAQSTSWKVSIHLHKL